VFCLVDRFTNISFFDNFIVFYRHYFLSILILSSELRFGAMYSADPDVVICVAGQRNAYLQFASSLTQRV
jgi:hypothetical protein